jgi:hypothetical protein
MISYFCAIAAAFGIVLSAPAYCLAPLAAVAGIHFLYTVYRRVFVQKDHTTLVLQGGVLSVFLIYMLLKKESALFYRALGELSLAVSGAVGAFLQRPIAMNPTYSGVDLVVLFLAATLLASLAYRERSARRYLARAACILLIWGVYIGLWTVLAENSIALGLNFLEPFTGPLDFRVLLFAALLTAFTLTRRRLMRASDAPGKTRRRSLAAGVLTALCLTAYLLSFAAPPAPVFAADRRVVFWDSGIAFTLPTSERYGLDNAGMFGLLPRYLEAQGYVCDVTETINARSLEKADVLVVLNPLKTPGPESLRAIWDFVERGGGLLAVGDHTGDAQIRLPLNAILEPADIAFNFDSAIPFKTLWPDEFVMRRSPIFAGVSEKQLQIVVGASLETRGRARPLLLGKCGYSDPGDLNNAADGFLGDMQFARGERIGDLVLAAETGYGEGIFVAFGDTSFLQNLTIAYSYPFVNNLFAYLTAGGAPGADGASDAENTANAPKRNAAASGAGVNGRETPGGNSAPGAPGEISAPRYDGSCLLEASRLPSFRIDKSDDAADGFIASVLRAGMFPYANLHTGLIEAMEQTRDLRLIALVEPAAALRREEQDALRTFVETGGTLMLFGTYRSPAATQSLFAQFGFSFENVPIGRVAPTQDPDMAFWNACPLLYDGRPAGETAETESLMDVWGYSVIARRDLGAGAVYAFGDADFIKNKNLENVDSYRAGNIAFLRGLLEGVARHGTRGGTEGEN